MSIINQALISGCGSAILREDELGPVANRSCRIGAEE
jgi:hypothetical protein